MESYVQPDNPGLEALGSELSAVDRELARLPGLKQQGDRIALDVEGPAKRRLSAEDLAARFDRLRRADQLDDGAARTLRDRYS